MMQPPPEFENLISRVQTFELLCIALLGTVSALLVVLLVTLHRMGHTIRELVAVFNNMKRPA